jgi:pimeloyl-ACP methyl ester carboxylesterase
MRMLSVRGVEVAVRQVGRGRDLVLLHGFQNDHTAWDPYIGRLDLDAYRVTAFDFVGCGASASGLDWKRCTIAEYAEDLIAVCDALRLPGPVVIGHSLGGATALEAALIHEDRLRALVLVAPASTTGLDFLPDAAAFESLAHPTPEQQHQLARAAFRHPPSEDEFEALLAVIARATPEHIEGAARSMRDFHRHDDLSSLRLPCLLVCGDRDRHVPLHNLLATHEAIPHCGLQVYHDVGHVPFAEVPDPAPPPPGPTSRHHAHRARLPAAANVPAPHEWRPDASQR